MTQPEGSGYRQAMLAARDNAREGQQRLVLERGLQQAHYSGRTWSRTIPMTAGDEDCQDNGGQGCNDAPSASP